ncbi:hypothetical protein [Nocardia sp. NPDC047654]|uniref:hypothetical protein n=1 Tax=Nocardia sp. NPDC047654 TaxID=3364314 RepID=UPI00372266CF
MIGGIDWRTDRLPSRRVQRDNEDRGVVSECFPRFGGTIQLVGVAIGDLACFR